MKQIYIEKDISGGRLDKLLFRYLDRAPAGFVYKMLRKKNIVLNDKKAAGSEILKEGDVIRLYLSDETVRGFSSAWTDGPVQNSASEKKRYAQKLKRLIIFEDENIIALNKPAGMLVQKAKPGDVSLNDMLLGYLPPAQAFTPGISNRLDRNTAGIVLAGKNLLASRLLNEAVKNRSIDKKYLVLVCAHMESELFLKGYLVKDEKTNTSYVVNEPAVCGRPLKVPAGAKLIKTKYAPLQSNNSFTLLEAELLTGRSHQIRAQLYAAGFPVAGDRKYADKNANEYLKKKYGLEGQFLCAYKIEFTKMEGELEYLNKKTLTAPLPENFAGVLKGEGLWQRGLQEA